MEIIWLKRSSNETTDEAEGTDSGEKRVKVPISSDESIPQRYTIPEMIARQKPRKEQESDDKEGSSSSSQKPRLNMIRIVDAKEEQEDL